MNLSIDRCLAQLADSLTDDATVLLLGAGGQRPDILTRLGAQRRVIAVDIDVNADVNAWADAHELPFRDQAFDAVICTAVLEHVIRPEAAIEEIGRVLRPAGRLYSEIPFIQQVHEGAYDFTRYTLIGHRRLAAAFDELESGVTAGPGTALFWSIEHFARALANGRAVTLTKLAVRLACWWLPLTDRVLASRPAALDGASCTFFGSPDVSVGRVNG